MQKTLRKCVWGTVGAFALVIAVLVAVGMAMPSRIEVTRTISINRPPENVWWVLTDYNSLAQWHPQYRSTGIISSPGERPTRWRALYTDGRTVNVEVSAEHSPDHYAERIADTNLPFSGGWELDLERRELTTQVTAHSRAELLRPLDRVFVYLFVKPDVELDRILERLKRRVEGSTVKPTAATSER